MSRTRRLALVGAVMALVFASSSCGQKPQTDAGEGLELSCPDGLPRLPLTGICQGSAAASLKFDNDARTPELLDCTWTVNELMLPGDEALLYRAAVCNGVTTTLGFSGGAHSAELAYERSALFGDAVKGKAPIRLFSSPADNPQGALQGSIAEAPDGAALQCAIRPANLEGWPTDALLIAPSAAMRATMPQDEPITACGPYGVDENSVRYWRIAQGFAWFYDLGQEDPDFDPTSFTVFVRTEDGWTVKD